MNRALAETLSALNLLIAVLIVVGGAGLGMIMWKTVLGLVFGLGVGFVVAALACGTLAYLALIERHLAKIAGHGVDGDMGSDRRRDPTL